MQGQDWNRIVLYGPGATAVGGAKKEIKPHGDSGEAARLAKLAESTEPVKPKLLSRESVTHIQAHRRANKLNQKQLDQQLAFPPNTINKLESRQIAPSPMQLNTLNRVLKTGLTLE